MERKFVWRSMFVLCSIVLSAVMLVGLVGCGSNSASETINVISREDGSGTRSAFIELFDILEKGSDGSKTDRTTPDANIVSKTDVMLATVEGDVNAIGYISLGSLSSRVKALAIDEVAATSENVRNGSYKISRPFVIATKSSVSHQSAIAQDFINFILSAEGQAVISKDYIAINDNAASFKTSGASGKITVGGSSSVSPVMEKLKETYIKLNPAASIEIQTSDSSAGITGAADGTFDIGMSSRDLKDTEKQTLTETGIAIDGLAVIVNQKSTLTGLTKDQVKSIFTGAILKWSNV